MTKTYNIEGMSCNSCVAKVKTELSNVEGIEAVQVQLQFPQATIKMGNGIPVHVLQSALSKAGPYQIKEAEKPALFNNKRNHKRCCC